MSLWALGVLVFCATCTLDYAHTNYVMAVHDRKRLRAASWSVVQWGAATIGFVVAVKVSLYLLPFEAAGLFVGTWLAVPRDPQVPRATVVSIRKDTDTTPERSATSAS